MSLDAFSHYFGEIDDPRQQAKISYPLFDALFLDHYTCSQPVKNWISESSKTRLLFEWAISFSAL